MSSQTARLLGGGLNLLAGALQLAIVTAITAAPPAARCGTGADSQAENKASEQELGEAIYGNLKAQRVIIASSPLYDVLTPISTAIVRVAQPRYYLPMKVWLVHSAQPNAFATPGGNIFVTDELLYFVKNREELAGTLCHEVSHLIHEDSLALAEKQQRLLRRELGATILLGPSAANILAITLIGKLQSLRYSRDVESRADLTGADVCASAGYNPWGLVWLFGAFENVKEGERPEFLSDHPDNQSRIDSLQQHFASDPARFSRFDSEERSATLLAVPKQAPVIFLR
jgi:beta-barrel assembly-enhancing protease